MRVVVCVQPRADSGKPPLGRDDRAALALARQVADATVIALCASAPNDEATPKAALGAGADSVVMLSGEALAFANFHTLGKALAFAARHVGADLVLTGARGNGRGLGAVGGSVAEHLAAPHVAQIDGLRRIEAKAVEISVLAGGARWRLAVPLPAVFSVTGARAASDNPGPGKTGPVQHLSIEEVGLDPNLIRRRESLLGTPTSARRTTITASRAEDFVKVLLG